MTHGKEEHFEKMLKLIERSDMQEEKVRIMRSLGAVKDEKLIQRVLEFAMSVRSDFFSSLQIVKLIPDRTCTLCEVASVCRHCKF